MNILLNNRQHHLRVQTAKLKRLVAFFLQRAERLDPSLRGAVSIVLLGDSGMRRLNRRFLGCDETTDVLSFRYATSAADPDDLTAGECVVNAQRALQVGPLHGGVARELALYLAHACDHLAGADDATETQRRRMRRREQRWLRQAKNQCLLTDSLLRS